MLLVMSTEHVILVGIGLGVLHLVKKVTIFSDCPDCAMNFDLIYNYSFNTTFKFEILFYDRPHCLSIHIVYILYKDY